MGDKPVFAVEFLSFRLAVMSFDNGYRVGRVEVGKFGEEQFAAELEKWLLAVKRRQG